MKATADEVTISREGSFDIAQQLSEVTVLGVRRKPIEVHVNGTLATEWEYLASQDKVVIRNMAANLNHPVSVTWK